MMFTSVPVVDLVYIASSPHQRPVLPLPTKIGRTDLPPIPPAPCRPLLRVFTLPPSPVWWQNFHLFLSFQLPQLFRSQFLHPFSLFLHHHVPPLVASPFSRCLMKFVTIALLPVVSFKRVCARDLVLLTLQRFRFALDGHPPVRFHVKAVSWHKHM